MNPSLLARLPSLKKAALIAAGTCVAILLFLWLALPRIIQSQAEKFVAAKTGYHLTLDRPQFNPFSLSLRLAKLQLSDPEGKPLLAFDELLVDISAASLPRRAAVFDAIRLDGLEVTLVELPGGALNWSPFLEALKGKEAQPASAGLPRFDIQSFILANGRLDFADRRNTPGFATRVEPLDLSLSDVSTLPDDSGKFKLSARTATGAQIALAGEIDLDPMVVAGTFSLQGLQLDQLAPYLKDALPAPPAGVAEVTANYRAGNTGNKLDVVVEQIEARLTGLRVPLDAGEGAAVTVGNLALKGGNFNLAQQSLAIGSVALGETRLELPRLGRSLDLAAMTLEDAHVDLAGRQAKLAKVALAGGVLNAARGPGGKIYLLEALTALASNRKAKSPGAPATEEKPWHFLLEQFELADFALAMREEGVSPAAEFKLERVALQVQGISEDLNVALPVRLSFNVATGGRFEAEGKYAPAGTAVDFKLKLVDLALKPAEPYLASKTTLAIADGRLSTQGRVSLDAKGPSYRGDFALRDLRLKETDTGEVLLAWKNLATQQFSVTPQRLDIGDLSLNGLDTRLIINKDKTTNIKRVIKPSVAEPVAAEAGVPVAPVAPDAPAFLVNVDRLRFYKGEMEFADYSLVLPFGTRIHGLRGSIGNLSSRPGAPGQVELEGEVDEYGMARAIGQVDLFNPTDEMDLKVVFRNVEMRRLTPYMATFAGRKIDSGKLSLDLEYKIKQRQLQGENKVILDRLILGERVESPTAKDLPLDLAIAILQDSDGRIDLGLPIAGSLDDPEFSYGQVVWKAITNVLTKIVTAPFRALGALFGGSGEKVESIAFEAGAKQLTPPEREKLVKIADVLGKRPGLILAVGGIYAEADRVALQEYQLRRAVLAQTGQSLPEKGDPGPISTRQPKIQAALESLFAERIGKSDLAALKEGFRSANPGQLEENAAGKMMSRLSGLLREKKTLNADEVAQLKGADFYAVLFDRLRETEKIGEDRLLALAQARGSSALEILKSSGGAPERLQLLPPEKGESTGDEVPLKMVLEAGATGSKEN
jgi:hypothetical protein